MNNEQITVSITYTLIVTKGREKRVHESDEEVLREVEKAYEEVEKVIQIKMKDIVLDVKELNDEDRQQRGIIVGRPIKYRDLVLERSRVYKALNEPEWCYFNYLKDFMKDVVAARNNLYIHFLERTLCKIA